MSLNYQVNCRVDQETNEAITRICTETGMSTADFIRAAINQYLQSEQDKFGCECCKDDKCAKSENTSSYCSTTEFEMMLRLMDQQNFLAGKIAVLTEYANEKLGLLNDTSTRILRLMNNVEKIQRGLPTQVDPEI